MNTSLLQTTLDAFKTTHHLTFPERYTRFSPRSATLLKSPRPKVMLSIYTPTAICWSETTPTPSSRWSLSIC